MEQEHMTCGSCKKELANIKGNVQFTCPQCNKGKITRCFYCRQLSTKYKCPSCEAEGPN